MLKFARPLLVLALLCLGITGSRAQGTPAVFINEIHYDNSGTDGGEFVEIAGPAGTNLAEYSIVLYNGSGGAAYDTDALSGLIPNQQDGYGTVSLGYPSNGIQNGSPDGIALVHNGVAIQFLSYEGTFVAVGGAANGMTGVDIGVSEDGSRPLGESLRLIGTGTGYSDFTWASSAAASPGAVNQGQTFGAPADSAPTVTGTSPAASASNVPVNSAIVITFSEGVNATASAFSLSCGTPRAFAQSASPAMSFTLTPGSNLPFSAHCTVGVTANQISDADGSDPPDQMDANFTFSFDTEAEVVEPPPVATNVIINELDSDTPGADVAEFVELYDGGAGLTHLDGLTLVFYNGSNDLSYAAFDLDGFTTDASGYFTLGNAAVPGVGLVFAGNLLQNGQDAVALYVGNAADFPANTPVTLANLQDAVVYDTDDADDPGLLALLNAGQPQVNENDGLNGTGESIGRCPDGSGGARNTTTYEAVTPSPDGANVCPPPPPPPIDSKIVISQFYGSGGSDGASYQNDYVELYNRSNAVVDLTGWSLQYAAAAGSGWDFNKTPLGGHIAPGQYYLVRLASNGAAGAPLPASNVAGPINMSGTNGKIALVDSFDALAGSCPIGNPHLMDLVGYGTANCGEGDTRAPALSLSTADLRLADGATDTDRNVEDFASGAPNPRRTAPIVELGPFLLTTDPSTNDTDVPRDPTLVLTFTEPVTVVDPWFDLTCTVTGQHDSYTLAGNGTIYDITPNVNLLAGETCTITVFKDQIHDQDTDDAGPNTDTLPANRSWSFTVATGAAPPYPQGVHLTMGNPSNATTDITHPENYLMEKPEYALSYDSDRGRPNWVSWHLSTEWYGTLTRIDTFRADPQVPPDWYRVQGFDFSGSGFDRGHMVPNADRDKETSIPINQATYLMTNMLAQAPGNNQGPWAALENELRAIADQSNELYVISGPEGAGGTGDQGGVTMTLANGHVSVPAKTWKVALVLPKMDGDDTARATCETRTIAVIMPNVDSIRETDWDDYLTSVDAVEALTGYDFFENLPDNIEYCVEAGINGDNPDEDLDPPVIHCAAADGAWHGDDVSLSCTATDAGSGLSNAADASFVLVTSIAIGVEDANASTGTRIVCDKLGNCATAGPIAGNKIDRKGPVITLMTPANGAFYQLDKTVAAAFSCADGGSGIATCAGTVANGAAIDTTSIGAKSFEVTATDAAGNTSSTSVSYTVVPKLPATIVITNIPADAVNGGSFTPAVAYSGDGQVHLRSETPSVCEVHGDRSVRFVGAGRCTVSAWATPSGTYQRVDGPLQSFVVQ